MKTSNAANTNIKASMAGNGELNSRSFLLLFELA